MTVNEVILAGCYGVNEVGGNEECRKAREEFQNALDAIPTWAWVVFFLIVGAFISTKMNNRK